MSEMGGLLLLFAQSAGMSLTRPEPTRIVVLSDIHLSPTHGFFWENWCAAREFADAAKSDAVIVNGDLAINGPDSDAEIAFAARALGKLRTRVMALPGNHDVGDEPPGHPAQIIDADRLARWDSSFAVDRWALDAGGWRLLGVNAQLFGSGLVREHEQDQWLDEQLSTGSAPPPCSCTSLSSSNTQPTMS
jgi:3',5'-cyclic AMP phosphodiesterase CpdA